MTWKRQTDTIAPSAPLYVVWELTLKCDHACLHCGSRAGKPRPGELSLEESLDVLDQLVALGTREITFIGGEAYLAPHWLDLVRAATDAGIHCTMTTGGRSLTPERARAAKEAGLVAVNVSIDGLKPAHDRLRHLRGSFDSAMAALDHAAAAGLRINSNCQINQVNLPDLEDLAQLLVDKGVRNWQVQLTGPMGRAADAIEWLLQPWQMLELVPRLAAIADAHEEVGFQVQAANNLGYFGPHEHRIRARPWGGCQAGRYVMGLESNGDLKGCPSLPSGPYVGGNVRKRTVADLYADQTVAFTEHRDQTELWGHCASCYYAADCMGGCSWTAHTLLGKRGNLPYCFHRAETLAARGIREEIVVAERAPGKPFDFGRFELVETPIKAS
jgi:radical SAM protein with 4Fe4S-binding SPASM domain